MKSDLQRLIDLHSELLTRNSYCYFELAYCKTTHWMAWICTDNRENNPDRVVLARGQGDSPEAAAKSALVSYVAKPPLTGTPCGVSGMRYPCLDGKPVDFTPAHDSYEAISLAQHIPSC